MVGRESRGILAPRLRFVAPVDLAAADATELGARGSRDGVRFAGADLSGSDLTGSTFSMCEFADVTFSDTQLRASRFSETLIGSSYASVLLGARTTWHDVLIERPRWGSAELFDSELNSVQISGGKIDFLNLRNARLDDVLVENCVIGELDLGSARVRRVSLRGCRIGMLDLTRASCADLDLRGADLAGLAGLEGLKGATVDAVQLSLLSPLFASHFGLTVE